MALLNPLYAAIRRKFSGDKTRFDDGRFSLDLTYITDRVMAMGFPGEGVESAYRNWIDDVAAMLEQYHSGHYMVFNLSGRDYDYSKLGNNVQSGWCAFPDHHPPPFGVLLRILQQIHRWLMADPLNIVCAHCFTTDHQILTNEGFRFLSDFQEREQDHSKSPLLVASYDHSSQTFSYQPFKLVVNKPSLQNMIEFSSDSFSLVVTHGHDMFIQSENQGYYKIEASQLLSNAAMKTCNFLSLAASGFNDNSNSDEHDWISSLNFRNDQLKINNFLRILGFWLGNDNLRVVINSIIFNDLKDSEVRFLTKQLSAFQIKFQHYSPNDAFSLSHIEIQEQSWCNFFKNEFKTDKSLPSWIFKLHKTYTRSFIEGLSNSSGNSLSFDAGKLLTNSLELRDKLIQLCIHAGYSVDFNQHSTKNGFWNIDFTESSKQTNLLCDLSQDVKKIKYNGQTWCVTVPTGLIITRRAFKDGKGNIIQASRPIIIGNCLAGKGRTGTVIASYLLYSGLFDNADDALNYFACKRSLTINGVTVPGQRRYVNYLHYLIALKQKPHTLGFTVTSINLNFAPNCSLGMGSGSGIVPSLSVFSVTGRKELVHNSTWAGPAPVFEAGKGPVIFKIQKAIRGDVLITLEHLPPFGRAEQVLRFSFHTGYIAQDSTSIIFRKLDLDNADVDARFPNDFCVEVFLSPAQFNSVEKERFDREIEAETALCDAALSRPPPIDGTLCWFDPSVDKSLFASIQAKVQQARCECGTQLQGAYIEKSGWLVKQGHQVKNWKKRWFVLKETISYFKSPKDTAPCGTIQLTDICGVVPDVAPPDPSHLYCFEIVVVPGLGSNSSTSTNNNIAPSPSSSPSVQIALPNMNAFSKPTVRYLVCAMDERQKDEWVEAIEIARMERKMPQSSLLDKRGSRVSQLQLR